MKATACVSLPVARDSGGNLHAPIVRGLVSLLVLPLLISPCVCPSATNESAYAIDLPTVLRLAGARNLDVQIARARLREAEANRSSALEQFFPWLSPGIGYHRRDGVAQAVPSGIISDAHFQSYSPGAALEAQVSLGDALYNSLAAKQQVKAADRGLDAQRQETVLAAAQAFFELQKQKALGNVQAEALNTSGEYEQQLHDAVAAGIAFKGDELRVRSQTEQYRVAIERAREQQRIAAVNLAQVLHLDPQVELLPPEGELEPITLFATNTPMETIVNQALQTRPELSESESLVAAARAGRDGAKYGPLIPTLRAQAFAGGLGGGPDSGPDTLGAEGDYTLGLSWRIGPGGLFDAGRVRAGEARFSAAQLSAAKLKDAVISQAVASLVRIRSLAAQIELARRNLAAADETLRLTRERKQYGVGLVLEDIQAQQALTQARSDYFTALTEYNKAQYALSQAVGTVPDGRAMPAR